MLGTQLREFDHKCGFQRFGTNRAFQVDMQLDFWHRRDIGFKRH